ncbi:probable serine/threonine-protein kinase kinX [Leguminivora glycinivorella]|uniref:probable serine/threonine-protein kinase kinX n=1 Tax=Leguminivora glycinivorella TaxID=1035111 RepID=UPI00200ECDB1|nr:probable serine/threonine-protein kinase kinX [Leguminivora glycinivorella]
MKEEMEEEEEKLSPERLWLKKTLREIKRRWDTFWDIHFVYFMRSRTERDTELRTDKGMVPWAILLFGVSLNSGHYIRKAENDSPSVYKVENDPSSVTFTNPKGDKRTLREILYYHIVERPRNEPVATERSFTNSHGYQFFDLAPLADTYDDKYLEDGSYVEEDNQEDGSYVEQDKDLEDDGSYKEDQDAEESENNVEELELPTTQKPLTDEEVKEAFKARSYLFDQMRQRDYKKRMAQLSLKRRKRQTEMESAPDASSYDSKAAYMQPKTYGMNLNGDTGYVWNNLNNPPTYFDVGNTDGNSDQGSPNQENIPTSENAYIPPVEPNESESSEDIYIVTNRPSAQPLGTIPETANPEPSNESPEVINENPGPIEYPAPINENPEPINENPGPVTDYPAPINENPEPINEYQPPINENPGPINDYPAPINNPEPINENPAPVNEYPEPINENPEPINEYPAPINENPEPTDNGATYPVEPIINDDNSNTKLENEGFATNEPEIYENPELNPVQPEITGPSVPQEGVDQEYPINERPVEESSENPGNGYEQPGRPKLDGSPDESSEGDDYYKNIPVAPTLPPLNYEGLPDYIRETISSSEKPATYEQTDNPYANPQPNPEDTEVLHDQMEGIFATMQPVEDIPKTYGMNLTGEGGHVWNDMNNQPVSYDVGTPSQPEEEHNEEPAPVSEEPEIRDPNTTEPENEGPIANPEPSQVPEIHESGENMPIEEEPIANPNEENHEPIPENNMPIEEPVPVQPEPTLEPENPELVSEPETKEPANPEFVPQPGNEEPANPELVPEPGNPELIPEPVSEQPENPEPLPDPDNPEPVPEPGNQEPGNPELIPEPGNGGTEQTSEEPSEEPHDLNLKPDIMSELLKSEQFWKWLGEWTSTYMELLEKHIRKIARQEICNREKSGEQMCPLEDESENNNDGVIIKDGKIIIDGREIDLTRTDNLNIDLKRGHHYNKGDKDKINKNENKVDASTIYGNSVGNEKVTNVFIFTADKADEVLENIKPDESDEEIIIDDRIKEENEDKNKEIDTEASESVVGNTEETDEGEENKEEIDNKETNEGEASEQENEDDNINEEDGEIIEIKQTDSEGSNEDLNKNVPNNESSSDIEELDKDEEPSESESN